jgi:hypothetical protein
MTIKRIKDLPENDGSISNDDIFLFMDDPAGEGVTKKISLSELSNAIGPVGYSPSGTSFPYLTLTNDGPFIVLSGLLGEPVTFTRTEEGNETDSIDEGLTLARGSVGALFNYETQEGYDNSSHAIDGAEWNSDGWGNLTDIPTRSYSTLRSVLNNQIGNNIIGAELVMHDTINDKYYKFSFSDWGENNGGSFAYTRNLITNTNYFKKNNYGEEIDTFIEDDPEGSGVGITRGNNQGIFNPYQEEGWNGGTSPAGTEWNADGWNNLSNIENRNYDNLDDAVIGGLGNALVGAELIMHIIGTDIYYAIKFLTWTQNNNGGGFSYVKYEIDLDKINEGITFADGTVLKSARGLDRVKSTASTNRRIEEVYGNKMVTVDPVVFTTLNTTVAAPSVNESIIWIDSSITEIDNILNNPSNYDITDNSRIQFSLDQNSWYTWTGSTSFSGDLRGYSLSGNITNNTGDTVYFRYGSGGAPKVWWNKNDLPGGPGYFRGAIIDYHAYTGEATIIGTIHIVDDDGEENITHTEVSSGSTDSENDDLWLVQNEGTISYRRMDTEGKTLKIHWAAKIFYGSELYD